MKKSRFIVGALTAVLAFCTFSCESLRSVLSTPSLSMESVGIQGLDLEGITFSCNYSISNPYPVAFSIQQVAADILYEGSTFTKLNTANGVTVAALGSKTNTLNFKVPYEAILNFAKSLSGKTALPFTLQGNASLDLSGVTNIENQSLTLPFSKSFNVPIFKPSFSVSDAKVQLPTLSDLRDSLVNGGMNPIRAATLAASIISGQGISADTFDDIDLNLDLLFNVNVKNEGSAPWKFALNTCSLTNANGKALANVAPDGNTTITSGSGTIPMKASLNTLKAGAFIAQLLTKKGTNPTFTLDSGLTFTDLSYASNLPLTYSHEIPLSQVNVTH